MTNIGNDINLLHIDEDSILDKSIRKRHRLPHTPISFDLIPIRSSDSLNSSIRSYTKSKSKSELKKTPATRLIYPIHHSRSKSSTRPVSYHEDERYHRHHSHSHSHHHHNHFQPPVKPMDVNDMRFFIIRHGERVDRYFGSNWFMLAFDQLGQYRPYHLNFPSNLPSRPNKYFWALDTPLTRDGLNAAQNVGQVLSLNHFEPTYVYSSPAMRCILTTYQILKGLGLEKKLPIRIEPGLLELGASRFGMSIFLKPIDWHHYGINVDLSYRPIMTDIPALEREEAYYLRSKYIIREIEQRHNNQSNSPLLNILLVAHATSPETLTWDLVGRQPNVYDLYNLSLNIGYLQMVITERKRQNKSWSLTQIPLQSTTLRWV
jgi:broad specificity phosphatase PhoE